MANTLLAAGCSPAMAEDPSEAAEFVGIASSLLVNIGTLGEEEEGMGHVLQGTRNKGAAVLRRRAAAAARSDIRRVEAQLRAHPSPAQRAAGPPPHPPLAGCVQVPTS